MSTLKPEVKHVWFILIISLCSMFVSYLVMPIATNLNIVTSNIVYNTSSSNTSSKNNMDNNFNGFSPIYSFTDFNSMFTVYMDINATMKNIKRYNKYKTLFKYGCIWKFDTNNNKIAVLIYYITSNHSTKFDSTKNPLSDMRYQYLKLENTLNYCFIHKYDLIFGTKTLFTFKSNNAKYMKYMSFPHWQKPFFIRLLFQYPYNYKWVFYVDFDALFINCSSSSSIQHFIDIAHQQYTEHSIKNVSFIFSGDGRQYLNSGVFIICNNHWSLKLLNDMIYVIENAEIYELIKIKIRKPKDQNLFAALVQGWNINNNTNLNALQNKVSKMIVPRFATEKQHYLDCIQDEYMKQYAIPIDRHSFNAVPSIWRKSRSIERQSIFIVHYMAEKGVNNMGAFGVILSLYRQHCKAIIDL